MRRGPTGRIQIGCFKVNIEEKPRESAQFPLKLGFSVLAGWAFMHMFEVFNWCVVAAINILQHGVSMAGNNAEE